MSVLENIERIQYQKDDVYKLIKLYQYRGKDFYYYNMFQSNLPAMRKELVQKDTIALVKFLDLKITDQRLKLLLTKGSKAKNKDEKLVKNIYHTIELAQHENAIFILKTNEMINLVLTLFKDVKSIPLGNRKEIVKDNLLEEEKLVSNRKKLDEFFDTYSGLLAAEEHETINLIVNFYIDFINFKPFDSENELLGLFLLYNLLIRERFSIMRYMPFFEVLYNNKDEFMMLVTKASYNYEVNMSQTEGLTRFIVNKLIENYNKLDEFMHSYEFDIKLNKGDNIENTISKLGQTFTKEDIRKVHPYVSESTINRTLKRLRDEGKISPLGTGRSASWIRILQDNDKTINGQIDFYHLGVVKDEK